MTEELALMYREGYFDGFDEGKNVFGCKSGKWIADHGNVKCSICGHTKDARGVGKNTHYCEFCGARMERANDKR